MQKITKIRGGLELIISNLCVKHYRSKERHILKFENITDCGCSNYWLVKEIEDTEIDLNFKQKIKLDKIKTTPNKHKERLLFVA